MTELLGEGYTAASFVHNKRGLNTWQDVWNCVCCQFFYILQAMEPEY